MEDACAHTWPYMGPYMGHMGAAIGHAYAHTWPYMGAYIGHMGAAMGHTWAHTWAIYGSSNGACIGAYMGHIWEQQWGMHRRIHGPYMGAYIGHMGAAMGHAYAHTWPYIGSPIGRAGRKGITGNPFPSLDQGRELS